MVEEHQRGTMHMQALQTTSTKEEAPLSYAETTGL